MTAYALAIDIGASGGRHMLGSLRDGRLALEEVYRFPNGALEAEGRLCWDLEALRRHIIQGMKECRRLGKIPASVGVDTWAVDYVLADEQGRLLSEARAYRDTRTAAYTGRLDAAWLYSRTGIAFQPFNTVYQLMSEPRELLSRAARCLMLPDYFHWMLSGSMSSEFTNASTTGLLDRRTGDWDPAVLQAAGIPPHLFPEKPLNPCARLGQLRPDIAEQAGFDCEVILPATHDTGSAYMAVPAADDRVVYLSSGTWSLLGTQLPEPILTEEARLAGFTNEGGYGGSTRFLRNIMGLWMLQRIRREQDERYSYAEMAEMALRGAAYACTVDAADGRFLAPGNMTAEILAALDEQEAPRPENESELLACVTRSLALCYAKAVKDMERVTGKSFTAIHIVGGGCKNRVLNQWTADAAGLPVLAGPDEATALGNVAAQLISRGELRDLREARSLIRKSFQMTSYEPKGESR